MTKPPTLQKEILLTLKKKEYDTVTSLALDLGYFRSSVSRSLHELMKQGLITKVGREIKLTPCGSWEAATIHHIYKKARGSLGWVDDQCAEFKCICGKWKESLIVSVEDVTECDGCGRRYILRQRTWVEEVIK